MRPDVKLGVATSLVVVLVAGGYYLYRDRGEPAIPVRDESVAVTDSSKDKAKPPAASTESETEPGKRITPAKRTGRSGGKTDANSKSRVTQGASPDTRRSRLRNQPAPSTPTSGIPADSVASSESKDAPAKPAVLDDRGRRTPQNNAEVPPTEQPRSIARDNDAVPEGDKVPASDTADGSASPNTRITTGDDPLRRHAPEKLAAGGALKDASSSAQASPPAAVPPARPSQTVETHRAQPGDTFASLARAYYGSERHTPFLIEQNSHIADPSRIRVGELIKLPPLAAMDKDHDKATSPRPVLAAASDSKSSTTPNKTSRTYEVKSGDSFYGVARDVLGDSSRWQELFELNKDAVNGDPKRLKVGQVIVLPSA